MKHLESGDPFELVGVRRPVEIDVETDTETARCLIEEYALAGFAANEILDLFASPAYAMPNAIYRRRGADFVTSLVDVVFGGVR
ncbi:MAG TPA: hypothetical protein VMP13_04960 [Acidimicrobiia bacterium]|nr:hypothetical protein [Acidimicrobiia bacterium]